MKKGGIIALILALVLFVGTGTTLAWLTDSGMNADINARAYIHKSYFESGNGSDNVTIDEDTGLIVTGNADAPFEIHTPVQLYYLAWLQELGYFNMTSNGSTIDTIHFYLSADLDMTGYVLPPIGTTSYEFVGNFDGQGYTISNLTVVSNDGSRTMTDAPTDDALTGTEIAGFFGVIGSLNGSTAHMCSEVGGTSVLGSYDKDENVVKNFVLENVTIVTEEQNALIGIAAGYVNGTVDQIAVADSGLVVTKSQTSTQAYTSNLSDYAIVGFCTDEYKAVLDSLQTVTAYLPAAQQSQFNTSESGNAWGGSLDMVGLVYRMLAAHNSTATAVTNETRYVTAKTVTTDETTGKDVESNVTYSSTNPLSDAHFYYNADYGSYYTVRYSSNSNTAPHMYGSGQNMVSTATVTRIVKKAEYDSNGNIVGYAKTDTFYLYNGNHYLSLNGGNTAVADSVRNSTALWSTDGEGHLFRQTEDNQYYLNASTTALSVGNTGTTEWNVDASGNYTFTSDDNTVYYLVYDESTWKVMPASSTTASTTAVAGYCITDGNGNYLQVTGKNANNFTNTTNISNATLWSFGTPASQSGTISTVYSNTTLYLRNNSGTLALYSGNTASNRTSWTNSNGHFSSTANSTTYYISYNGSWKLLTSASGYLISDGNGHYLNAQYANSTYSLTSGTDMNTATIWTFSNYGGNGNISTTVNNNTRYLYVTRSGNRNNYTYTLGLNSSSQNWSIVSDKLRNGSYTDRYLNWSSNTWSVNTSGITPSIASITAKAVRCNVPRTPLTKENVGQVNLVTRTVTTEPTGIACYMPISVAGDADTFKDFANEGSASDFATEESNTGYIVGGYYSGTSSSGSGDVRASGYSINDISGSYTNGNFTKIYTIDGNSSTNHDTTIYDASDSSVTAYKNYAKFDIALEQLRQMLQNCVDPDTGKENVYGIHFMDSQISTERMITANQVTINGETYYDYQLPESCIDFNLKEKGYINFFGGTYYGGNDESFFSIHQIIRNAASTEDENYDPYYEPNEIIAIKQIAKVYEDVEDSLRVYVYQYKDGSFSADDDGNPYENEAAVLADGYSMVFDTEWIGDRTQYMSSTQLPQNRIYYFEIPANEGEYALGSVAGVDGAYLMYLDISAAAQTVDRIQTLEKFEIESASVSYPNGVQFVASDDVYTSAADSATFTISSSDVAVSETGYTFTRTSGSSSETATPDLITPDPTTGISVSYTGAGVGVPADMPSVPSAIDTSSSAVLQTIWRIIDNDINQTSKVSTRQVTTVTEDPSESVWYVRTEVWLTDNSGTPTTTDPIGTLTYTCPADAQISQSYIYIPGAEGAPGTYSVFLSSRDENLTEVSLTAADGYSVKLNGNIPASTSETITAASVVGETTPPSLLPSIASTVDSAETALLYHYAVPDDVTDLTSVFDIPVFTAQDDVNLLVPDKSKIESLTGGANTIDYTITAVEYGEATVTGTATSDAKPVTPLMDLQGSEWVTLDTVTYESSSDAAD